MDPQSWQAYNNRGNLFSVMGQLDEAQTAFEQAIIRAPRNAECHYNIANVPQDLGRHAEAMACYGKPFPCSPISSTPWSIAPVQR